MKANTMKMKNIVNPYPRGVMPFRAIPVRDAFPHHVWATLPVFNPYHALVPNRLPENAPIRSACDFQTCLKRVRQWVDEARRRDLASVIACAMDDARERDDIDTLYELERIDPKAMRMPSVIRYRYSQTLTTRTYTRNDTTPDSVSVSRQPMSRLIEIDDIIREGYGYALHHSEEMTKVKFAHAALLSAERGGMMNEERADYKMALAYERNREWHWQQTEQGAFESSMLSLDAATGEGADFADRESAWATDGGAGADAIREFDHGERREAQSRRKADYKRAFMRVWRRNPKLLDVFKLVVKNGTNRKESIWELMIMMRHKAQRRFTKARCGMQQTCDTPATSNGS